MSGNGVQLPKYSIGVGDRFAQEVKGATGGLHGGGTRQCGDCADVEQVQPPAHHPRIRAGKHACGSRRGGEGARLEGALSGRRRRACVGSAAETRDRLASALLK